MEHNADHSQLEDGDLVVLKTKLNPKTGKIGFSPSFPSFDSSVNPDSEWFDEYWEKSIRIFRSVNNGFSLENEGEEWLVKVTKIEIDEEKQRTKDGRIYTYIYVEVLERKERVAREYRRAENLYVEEVRSGSAILSGRTVEKLTVEDKFFRSGNLVVKGRAISSPDGELLLVEVLNTETKKDYFTRTVAQMQKSPFTAALNKFGTPEEVAAREWSSLPHLPTPDKVQRF